MPGKPGWIVVRRAGFADAMGAITLFRLALISKLRLIAV
jgi:hypothetical protein